MLVAVVDINCNQHYCSNIHYFLLLCIPGWTDAFNPACFYNIWKYLFAGTYVIDVSVHLRCQIDIEKFECCEFLMFIWLFSFYAFQFIFMHSATFLAFEFI